MLKLKVQNLDGKAQGDIELDASVFAAEINEHLLWETVKMQRARARVGTASTKRRDEVRGGGKKPFKQKGTGNARQGSTRAPHFVGGGSAFGPKPRDYYYSMPKKALANALRSVLSLRAKESKLFVVADFKLSAIKTKSVVAALDKIAGAGGALVVDGENANLGKSIRNLGCSKFLRTEGINVYDVLNHPALILTKSTVEALTTRLKTEAKASDPAEAAPKAKASSATAPAAKPPATPKATPSATKKDGAA